MDSLINDNAYIKLRAKALLCGCNAKLFFTAAFSITLRAVLLAAVLPGIYLLVRPSLSGVLAALFKKPLFAAPILFGTYFLRSVICLIAAALRLGEQYAFFTRAAGGIPKFGQLFAFFAPRRASAAFSLYGKLVFYRAAWLAVFLLPGTLILEGAALGFYRGTLPAAVLAVLIAGSALLSAVGFIFFGASCARYCTAAIYVAGGTKPSLAIRKSTLACDGAISGYLKLRASLAGWYLLCLTGAGLIYALPYIKLADAVFAMHIYKNTQSPGDIGIPIIRTGRANT